MRPAHDMAAATHSPATHAAHSTTPIYDALYAEYRRQFRALPGDRTGEEELGLEAIRGIWGRTSIATGSWDSPTPYRQPQPHHTRGYFPAALPPGPRDIRHHGR
jgi:hypothetical protein